MIRNLKVKCLKVKFLRPSMRKKSRMLCNSERQLCQVISISVPSPCTAFGSRGLSSHVEIVRAQAARSAQGFIPGVFCLSIWFGRCGADRRAFSGLGAVVFLDPGPTNRSESTERQQNRTQYPKYQVNVFLDTVK